MRVLMIALNMSRESTGESHVAFKIAQALSSRVSLTVLAFQSTHHTPLAQQLPEAEVVTWPEPGYISLFGGSARLLKPGWVEFYFRVKAFLARNRDRFDVAHQIMPAAPRYPTPLVTSDLPYVVGPLGGSLDTPPAFAREAVGTPWMTRLRRFDAFRLRHDPWLRAGYAKAAMVLGVAPYVEDILRAVPLRRYENFLKLGIEEMAPPRPPRIGPGLRLLHVGRAVRTKGLRDVVRAMAQLRDLPDVTLVSAGDGEEIPICRAEAERLGVADRVAFLGMVSRARVEELYAEADVFVFPSFREPAGNVLYEAMRWGLPIIAARRGGPDWIVDDSCGLKVDAENPEQMARDVAMAIRTLAGDPALHARLSAGARQKMQQEGRWSVKADRLVALYREAVS